MTFSTDDDGEVDDVGNADNDTTLVISTDDDMPTLEVPSDEETVTGKSDNCDSSFSDIPTDYNPETGEFYQNQLANPVLAAKCSNLDS